MNFNQKTHFDFLDKSVRKIQLYNKFARIHFPFLYAVLGIIFFILIGCATVVVERACDEGGIILVTFSTLSILALVLVFAYDYKSAERINHQFFWKPWIIIFIVIAASAALGVNQHFDTKENSTILESTNSFYHVEIEQTNLFFSNSNSYLMGQIATISGQLQGAQKNFENYKSDSENQILNLKQDNTRLVEEKDNAELRITELEKMPETAFLAYSNADALNKLYSSSPDYQLQINGKDLTNYFVITPTESYYEIFVSTNREIDITVKSLKDTDMIVEKLTVDFACPLDSTNFVSGLADGNWTHLPGNFGYVDALPSAIYEIVAQHDTTETYGFSATPLIISTNLPNSILKNHNVFPARIDIFSPGVRGMKEFALNFAMPQ